MFLLYIVLAGQGQNKVIDLHPCSLAWWASAGQLVYTHYVAISVCPSRGGGCRVVDSPFRLDCGVLGGVACSCPFLLAGLQYCALPQFSLHLGKEGAVGLWCRGVSY